MDLLIDSLALVNDVIQAAIVIFGAAVVLYNARASLRDRVIRAFTALVGFVVIVYLAELMANRTTAALSSENWLRLEWIGIALVPAAQFHLSDALLVTTGLISRRRRLFVRVAYLSGLAFMAVALESDWIGRDIIATARAPHLTAGPLFVLFAAYFWLVTAVSIYNVWRARQRCVISTTRERMTMILLAIMAAPLGVFPYLMATTRAAADVSLFLWVTLLVGNIVVGLMFSLLTYYLAYFGAVTPDRVVRVRLFKFMARVPLTATIVLLVYVLVIRAGSVLGLPVETALAFAVVATVMLVEWAIHAWKRPLERLFQLNDDPDIRRIQSLSERVLTTRDLHQFLESVLMATCDALRSPAAFIAAIGPDQPQLEVAIGPVDEPDGLLTEANWDQLSGNGGNPSATLQTVDDFLVWQDFWIRRLYDRHGQELLGIMGIKARSVTPNLTPDERLVLERLVSQAALALEDRFLQRQVFAAVEGLLPKVTELQARRSAAAYGGTPALIAEDGADAALVDDPAFVGMVRDALSHYWGGPKLTDSPLTRLRVVQSAVAEHDDNPTNALRAILARAIEQQKPEGERNLTTAEWILYNILELKFVQGRRVRDVARRLAMSESDLYRKQRVAIENVARAVSSMERAAHDGDGGHSAAESPA